MTSTNKKTKLGKGFSIQSQTKEIILNFKEYFEKKLRPCYKEDVIDALVEGSKLSKSSIKRIINNEIISPKKTNARPKKYEWDTFDKGIINSIISDFHKNKKLPYINDVFNKLAEHSDLSFKDCGYTTFTKIIKRMGFKYMKTNNLSRKILMERADIIVKRREYLKEKLKLKREYPRSLWIYLDETFVHLNFAKSKILVDRNQVDNNQLPNLKIPIDKGTRFSIIHAGSKNGFVENAGKVLINEEINSEKFEEWLRDQLLPNLPLQSIIVLDNAPTHSKQYNKTPTQSNTKQQIKDWLNKNNIRFSENSLKPELLKLVKEHSSGKSYTVDKMIKDYGHIPIRLPPYHCEFNPIEHVWGQMKEFISTRNIHNNRKESEKLIWDSMDNITANNLNNYVQKCEKLEQNYW
jgi:transposase